VPDAGYEIDHMTCRQLEPSIVDFARMVARPTDGRAEDVRIAAHLLECPTCAGLFERERTMSAALRRLASVVEGPAPNPRQEDALLVRFDTAAARTPPRGHRPIWTTFAAAGLMLATVLTLMLRTLLTWHSAGVPNLSAGHVPAPSTVASEKQMHSPASDTPVAATKQPAAIRAQTPPARRADVRSAGLADPTDFVAWPGAAAWPPFESGELIRIDLPIDAVARIGFAPLDSDATVVQADVLIGQDGFARAIRLVR
jgi:hypothetical protein